MATNNVNLGTGYANGMMFFAPEDTALPAYPSEELGVDWVDVGDVSADGIQWKPFGTTESLTNWAKETVRTMVTERGTISPPIISTTENSLEAIFGDDLIVTAATATHGKLISIDTDAFSSFKPKAFLFLMKDGEDMQMIGATSAIITELADVDFKSDGAVTWTPTIEANWTYMKDDGQTTTP